MGDRSNIFFKDGKHGIGIYGHWAGTGMAKAAMEVLNNPAFKRRLGDGSYATRIGVQQALLTLEGLWSDSTGMDDNSYRIVVIDVETGKVYVTPAGRYCDPEPKDEIKDPTEAAIAGAMESRR